MGGVEWSGGQTQPRWELQTAGEVERSAVGRTVRWADGSAGIYRWRVEWSGAPWGGHLGGQTEPRWELQMAGGVERSAVGWTVS